MKQSSAYKLRFQNTIDKCISSLGTPKDRKLLTGLEGIDSATGGFATGDVSIILGESGSGKSCLLRSLALTASGNNHVLYVPLQDGLAENGTLKLIALEAGLEPSALGARGDSGNRILALEAGDRLKKADLGIYAADEMMYPMLLEAVTEDYTGYVDVDPIEGTGFVFIDSLSMLDDGDVKQLIRALKGLAFGSDLAIVASATGGPELVSYVADAGCIVQLGSSESGEPGKLSLSVTVLKDNWGPNAGRKTSLLLDKSTLAIEGVSK